MSLYNMVHGTNPFAGMLLGFLGITAANVPRFRDCYIEDGEIIIYTRTGGGNRDCYERGGEAQQEYNQDGPLNDDLRDLPGFVADADDDFDCTYATFRFKPSDEAALLVEQIGALGTEAPADKWRKLFTDMAANRDSPRVAAALAAAAPLVEAISSLVDTHPKDGDAQQAPLVSGDGADRQAPDLA